MGPSKFIHHCGVGRGMNSGRVQDESNDLFLDPSQFFPLIYIQIKFIEMI